MKNLSSVSLIIVFCGLLLWGCEKKESAPALPPAKSMTIDFSNFIASTKSANLDFQTKGNGSVSNTNWFLAATTAGFWNLILTVNLVIPVTAFNKAIDNTPVYIDNKTWEWKYSVLVLGATYNARLTGQIQTNDVKWEMYISRDGAGAFDEFLWFNGTSALNGKSGQWILNHSQLFQEPMLEINWVLNGTNIGTIKYLYVRDLKDNRTTDLFKTSYIEYGLKAATLNAFYNIYYNASSTISDFKDVNIEWNTTTHEGHIKALHYYQDINWHCWNGAGVDVTCN
jgi:hypothetical protein